MYSRSKPLHLFARTDTCYPAVAMFNFTALPPLSLYLHLPWCVRKCPYCDFNSHEARGEVPERAYLDALVADLEQDLPSIWGRPVETVFLGGGTPSLFPPDSIDRLFSQLRARLVLPAHAEITMEANPGTLEAGRFAEFRAAGINRLSIGVQSFDDAMLKKLGRIHGAREAGFEFMLNALRLNEGFPVALFAQHTGLPLTVVEGPLRAAEQKGLITWDLHQIRTTELGWRFLNDLTALLLPED